MNVIIGFIAGCMVGGLFGFIMSGVMVNCARYDELADSKKPEELINEYKKEKDL